jgi:hypothetical protein
MHYYAVGRSTVEDVMAASYIDELSQNKCALLRQPMQLRFGSCENKLLSLFYSGYGSIMHFVTELLKKKINVFYVNFPFLPHREHIMFPVKKTNRGVLYRDKMTVYCKNKNEHTNIYKYINK